MQNRVCKVYKESKMVVVVVGGLHTILIVAFVGPGLSLTSMEEHLHAAPD